MQELLGLTAAQPDIHLSSGDVLLQEGETTGRLFVLVDGSLMVRRGDEDFIAITTPGACVGEMAILLDRPHTASVVATSSSRVRLLHDAADALTENPVVLHAVATLLARRLDLVNGYLADLHGQYADHDGGLGMVGDVLKHLAAHPGQTSDPGSEREPDPLY